MRAKIELTPSDLKALEQLRRAAARRCRISRRKKGSSMPRPCCNRDDAHLLALTKPELIPECPECGGVWRGREDFELINPHLLRELVVDGERSGGERDE